MSYFGNMGPQTEMIFFLKLLLKLGMGIDDLKKSNTYLTFELFLVMIQYKVGYI